MNKEYFYISEEETIESIGNFDNIDSAFDYIESNEIVALYVFSKDTAKRWLIEIINYLQ